MIKALLEQLLALTQHRLFDPAGSAPDTKPAAVTAPAARQDPPRKKRRRHL